VIHWRGQKSCQGSVLGIENYNLMEAFVLLCSRVFPA